MIFFLPPIALWKGAGSWSIFLCLLPSLEFMKQEDPFLRTTKKLLNNKEIRVKFCKRESETGGGCLLLPVLLWFQFCQQMLV